MSTPPMTVRTHLDFKLNQTPRYWFNGNPYATRFMDSIMMVFPIGERYFIETVRHYKDRIKDPVLLAAVADFTKQEAQHGLQHQRLNQELSKQGLPVDALLTEFSAFIKQLETFPHQAQVAITAGLEHMTALMADAFFSDPVVTAQWDSHVRALMAWHAIEEMEHRAVAFDVMTTVAKVNYAMRSIVMVRAFSYFWLHTLIRTDQMLKADGFSRLQRLNMARKTLPLFFGRKGILTNVTPQFLQYFKPSFHPNDIPVMKHYPRWQAEFEINHDPTQALALMFAA